MRQLTSSDIDELEELLRNQRDSVLDAIRSRLAGRDEDQQRILINYFVQGDSRAAAELLADADIAMLGQELTELADIDAAIKRFEFGVGGLCKVCGNSIPVARLRAAPASLTCLDCQRRIEAAGGAGQAPG